MVLFHGCISQLDPWQLNRKKNEQGFPHFSLSHEKVHRMSEIFGLLSYLCYSKHS
jgi:hypothetical protein